MALLVKPFLYFLCYKVLAEFMLDKGAPIIMCACIAVAVTMVEFVYGGFLMATFARVVGDVRLGFSSNPVGEFFATSAGALVVVCAAVVGIASLLMFSFGDYASSRYFWKGFFARHFGEIALVFLVPTVVWNLILIFSLAGRIEERA